MASCERSPAPGADQDVTWREDRRGLRQGPAALIVYADTSALVKLLLVEAGSDEMRELLGSAGSAVTVTIGQVELAAALAAARRAGRIRETNGRLARRVASLWSQVSALALSADLLREATGLAIEQRLRGYDAVHLAGLMQLGEPRPDLEFACWDDELRGVAAAFGYRLFPE